MIGVHGTDGFTGALEVAQHFGLREVGVIDRVGVDGVLEVATLGNGRRYKKGLRGSMAKKPTL